jgi:hypothetical protein
VSDTEITPAPADGGRQLNPILLGLLILVALVGLFFLVVRPLLAGDVPDETATPAATPAATSEEVEQPVEGDVASDGVSDVDQLPVVTYEVFLARDPFDPVVPEPVAVVEPVATDDGTTDGGTTDGATDGATDGGTTDGGTTDGGTTDGGTTDGGTTDGGTTDGGTTDGGQTPAAGCSGEDTVTCDGRIVSLVEVQGSGTAALAIVQVDSSLYEVAAGDTFAGSFHLGSISGSCATVLYGDDAFELCEGDRVLK